jgi:hypothetical protein
VREDGEQREPDIKAEMQNQAGKDRQIDRQGWGAHRSGACL